VVPSTAQPQEFGFTKAKVTILVTPESATGMMTSVKTIHQLQRIVGIGP
jgi:hypothetical protein